MNIELWIDQQNDFSTKTLDEDHMTEQEFTILRKKRLLSIIHI